MKQAEGSRKSTEVYRTDYVHRLNRYTKGDWEGKICIISHRVWDRLQEVGDEMYLGNLFQNQGGDMITHNYFTCFPPILEKPTRWGAPTSTTKYHFFPSSYVNLLYLIDFQLIANIEMKASKLKKKILKQHPKR